MADSVEKDNVAPVGTAAGEMAADATSETSGGEEAATAAAAAATEKTIVPSATPSSPQITYPGPLLTSVLYLGLLLAMFLVALDISIISTAIPTITAQFHSVDQIGWYGSAFFMTLAAFQAFWGKAYKFFPLKTVFLTCIALFELGSLVVATAPSSNAIIVGRAIQGMGGAGVTGGCYIICAFITRPQHISAVLGIFSVVWSCSSVLGPVLGGVFTQDVTWRWCFYINLPIGGATILIMFLLFHTPAHSRLAHVEWRDAFLMFDVPGVAILLAAFTCLLLALEDGGVTMPWSESEPIGLLVGFACIAAVFILWEWKQGEKAMVVPRILKRRSIIVVSLFAFFAQGAGFARTYNLPIYFQAAQGVSPSESGIRTLPTVLTTSLFSLLCSAAVGRLGYYAPFLWTGGILITLGSGLIFTLQADSGSGKYIGYQVLVSVGSGLIIQLPIIVAQAISARVDMSVAISIASFFQFVGGTIGVSAAQNIQNNVLIEAIKRDGDIDVNAVINAGSTGLRQAFPDPVIYQKVVATYIDGLHAAWIWGIALSGLAFLVSLASEWRSIRPDDVKKRAQLKREKDALTHPTTT